AYRLPRESTAMACTQFSSPGRSRPSTPLGMVHSCSSLPAVLNFMNTWSLGGQPRAPSSGRHCIGGEPDTQTSSFFVPHSPPGVLVLRHTQAPRRHQVPPDGQQLAGLVEDLDADVVAVGDVQPAFRVHGDGVGDAELPRPAAQLAPVLDVLALPVEMDHAGV